MTHESSVDKFFFNKVSTIHLADPSPPGSNNSQSASSRNSLSTSSAWDSSVLRGLSLPYRFLPPSYAIPTITPVLT
eukprot:3698311-Rhodomonas_salina.1